MKWNKRFEYPTSMRSMIGGKRHYDIDAGNKKLPSVTTILGQTLGNFLLPASIS